MPIKSAQCSGMSERASAKGTAQINAGKEKPRVLCSQALPWANLGRRWRSYLWQAVKLMAWAVNLNLGPATAQHA
jgi:hypothetical protein